MEENISYKSEIYRKLFHLGMLILPISYFFLTKKQLLFFLLPIAALVIALDYSRRKFPEAKIIIDKLFSKIYRDHELSGELSGASYVAIAASIIFVFFPKVIAINAFTILAISDALASLVGRRVPSQPFFEKSLAGALAFFISALVILIFYGIIFKENFPYYLFGFFAVFATTVVESRPSLLKLDDNLSVPLTFSVVMFLFDLLWVYQY